MNLTFILSGLSLDDINEKRKTFENFKLATESEEVLNILSSLHNLENYNNFEDLFENYRLKNLKQKALSYFGGIECMENLLIDQIDEKFYEFIVNNDWNNGMIEAATEGHKYLVEFFIEKGQMIGIWE